MSLIYLDSSVVIYLVERHPLYGARIENALAEAREATLATSRLVELEVLVKPLQEGRADTVALYRDFLSALQLLPITDATFEQALPLRVYHRLKTPDAIHLALARQYGCKQLCSAIPTAIISSCRGMANISPAFAFLRLTRLEAV